MVTDKRKGSHPSKNGKTIGITLRVPTEVITVYDDIAARANLIDLKRGGAGGMTAQDVMRHRLASLPLVKMKGSGNE